MRLALAQYALDSALQPNLDKALSSMAAAAKQGAQLIMFPELCLSPFFPQFAGRNVSQYVATFADDCVREFQSACRRLQLAASPNVYLREQDRFFDASLM